ncbi:MAG: hypothetical protein MZV49_04975 [Rhodopseudomonas palustris]|nr:hypothetical protein [Rhodopseudomonas palustris]
MYSSRSWKAARLYVKGIIEPIEEEAVPEEEKHDQDADHTELLPQAAVRYFLSEFSTHRLEVMKFSMAKVVQGRPPRFWLFIFRPYAGLFCFRHYPESPG